MHQTLPEQMRDMSRRAAELEKELREADHYRKPIVQVAIKAIQDEVFRMGQRARQWGLTIS